ncbi:LysE family translocator [Millisia brevis]|uniref:LysE family translocator n=1 Tax=Millisia brevis TaxID=264148 RepID=UPI0008350581|nr:LysE family translocator [Millisia brevis]
MEQFLAVAAAHAVALLIPGVDFFLIVRTATVDGWRRATGVCLGIAAANGMFIALAFSGIALISDSTVLRVIQAAGGVFLTYLGVLFLRSVGRLSHEEPRTTPSRGWFGNVITGFASGALNPKNALFYVSLAAALTDVGPRVLALYGIWMFAVVLAWDLFIARILGSETARARFGRLLPWITKVAGTVLVLFGVGMVVDVLAGVLG